MDLITHAALGAASAAAVAPASRLRPAAAAGAAGGLLPDADILIASSTDPLLNLEFHRHFTHSVAFWPLGAAIAAAALWLLMRRHTPFALLYLAALAGYLAAILLDACTSYGTHLWWPFSHIPVALSVISVVDPLFTALVLIPLAWSLVRQRRRAAQSAVALALAGLAVGLIQHLRATEHAAALAAARGHSPSLLLVKPTLANLVLWRSLYLHEGRLYADAVRVGLPGNADVYPGESAPRFDPAADASLPPGSPARRDLERFVAFTGGLAVRHPQRRDFVGDARYAMLPTSIAPLWGVVVPLQGEAALRFENLRILTPGIRDRFVAMLLGRPLPAAP
jgi:inner membrane protein